MRFLENYFSHSPLFLAAHGAIWCVAVVLTCLLERDRRRLSRGLVVELGITEAQFKKITTPLERYDLYFDLCSSAFILIGLIGTIYGFASAIPNLTSEGYDFHEFGNALSTSAFGIIWSLLLNVFLAIYHMLFIDRKVEQLRQYQTIEDLGQTIARNMQAVGAEFVPHITASLERFATASIELAGATTQLVTASHDSAAGFREVATKTSETAVKVDQVLKKATKLPDTITSRLDELFSSASDSLSQSAAKLTTALGALEGIPESLRKKLEGAFAAQLDQLNAAGDRLRALHDRLLQEFQHRTEEAFRAQVETLKLAHEDSRAAEQQLYQLWADRLESAVTGFSGLITRVEGLPETIAGQMRSLVDAYRKILEEQHANMTEELRRAGNSIVRDQLETLKEAANDQKRQSERLTETFDAVYNEERRKLHEAIHLALADAVRWVEDFRKQLQQVQRELPEEMKHGQLQLIESTTKASQAIIQSAATLDVEAQDVHRVLSQVNASMAEFKSVVADLAQVVAGFPRMASMGASQSFIPHPSQPREAPQPFVSQPREAAQVVGRDVYHPPQAVAQSDATIPGPQIQKNSHKGPFARFFGRWGN